MKAYDIPPRRFFSFSKILRAREDMRARDSRAKFFFRVGGRVGYRCKAHDVPSSKLQKF